MTELGDLWEQYQALLNSGSERNDKVRSLEEEIHRVQKEKGWSRYDFDKKWERKIENSTPSIEGPPAMDSKAPTDEKPVPVSHFTFEQAKKKVGNNNYNILEDCAMETEAEMICLAEIHNRLNPDNSNVARRGQCINLSLTKFRTRKEEPVEE